MLHELRVENLLLIERAELELAGGLNVLTGETGAGKTVLAHALDLLLGGRPRGGIVRPGSAEAYVEGVFALPDALRGERGELLPADAEEVVLARRVGADGRTRAYVNGRSAGLADLRRLGEGLLAFYGQHEHRKLTLAAAQLEILDGFCGPTQAARRRACAEAHRELQRLRGELDDLRELACARERELDLLEHELAEIDDAAPQPGELQRLREQRERLRRMDGLRLAATGAAEALAPAGAEEPAGAAALLARAAAVLDALAGVDGELDALAARCRALQIEGEDAAEELRRYGEGLDAQEGALQTLEERLAVLDRLARKHGGTLEEVLDYARQARERRERIVGAAVAFAEVAERVAAAELVFQERSAALHAARARAAPRLAKAVRGQLADLAMPDASFDVEVREREPGPAGRDRVELSIAPNPGVAAAPVREIASGGELSRVMLALTAACDGGGRARAGELPTLIFDEIDAGIGGQTARAVGERLRELAGGRQLLCITHLPQIASLAERHFALVKDTSAEPTVTVVRRLGERDVVAELVRMLGADDDDASARRHARELRRAA
ncbi:MAG TPA: DNA repair protein RecN [Solirubrobacteraceae bacterium]|nr:DNA repair protein RecN [Solirubrobacteraceae bacterium]